MSRTERSRTRLSRLALVFLSTAASLLLLEGFVRAFFRQETDTAALREGPAPASVVPFVRRVADPELLYDLKPGARVLGWDGVRVEVDASGCCRVVPGRRVDDAGALRIAILGDSTPFGWRLPFEQSYGEQLRPLLEHSLRKSVALRNYAVPGYNSQQNRVAFRDKVLPWRPHLLVLHYDHNDSEPMNDTPTGYLSPEYGDNALNSMLLKLLRRRLSRPPARSTISFKADPAHPERLLHGYRYEGPQFEHHMLEMRALASLASERGIPVVVFVWNPWLRRSASPESDPFYALLHKPVSARLSSMGFYVSDSYALYQGIMRRDGRDDLSALWISASDAHPNAEGHRVIARYLLGEVLKALRGQNA